MDFQDIVTKLKGFSPTPELDARIFCDGRLPTHNQIVEFIERRKAGEPVSKIIGEKGFWKFVFKTSKDVLDPRPDSETMIETVLSYYPIDNKALKILDIGTGSGCLLASLLSEYPNAVGVGLDISDAALKIAQENLKGLQAKLIQKDFMLPDWFQGIDTFDIIISNPPYIPTKEIENLENAVKLYDPLLALDGGEDGLNAYRQLAKTLHNVINNTAKVFFEIGQGQSEDVKTIMRQNNWKFLSAHCDLGGIIRILVFEK